MLEHSPEFNAAHFDRPESWPDDGEGWSAAWGGSDRQWELLVEPLAGAIVGKDIIEIGCGHGRWSHRLAETAKSYIGVDVSAGCVEYCAKRIPAHPFVRNDGRTIPAGDASCDVVFSFDSLVHADVESSCSYIRECFRVLRPNGRAFLHLSNFADCGATSNDGWRAPDGDWKKYRDTLLEFSNFDARIEKVAWLNTRWLNDCFVMIQREPGPGRISILNRMNFMAEAGGA